MLPISVCEDARTRSVNASYHSPLLSLGFCLQVKNHHNHVNRRHLKPSVLPSLVVVSSSTSFSDVPKLPLSSGPFPVPAGSLSADGFVAYFKPKSQTIWIELHQPLVLPPTNLPAWAPNLGSFPVVLEDQLSYLLLRVNSPTPTLGLPST